MSRTPEGIEKEKVRVFLRSIGAYQHWPVLSGYGTMALDCYACIQGEFWGIEVKAINKNPTARQANCMQQIQQAGGWTACGTAEHIIHVLREHYKHPDL